MKLELDTMGAGGLYDIQVRDDPDPDGFGMLAHMKFMHVADFKLFELNIPLTPACVKRLKMLTDYAEKKMREKGVFD